MSQITVEMGKSSIHSCSCCGGTTETVWGYIYFDEEPRAVYYVRWTEQHPEQSLSFALSIGNWGEGAAPAARSMAALDCRLMENGPVFMVVDAADSAFAKPFLGAMLSRQDVLSSVIKQEAFDMIDRILVEDSRVNAFINKDS